MLSDILQFSRTCWKNQKNISINKTFYIYVPPIRLSMLFYSVQADHSKCGCILSALLQQRVASILSKLGII